ncbi:hypothetical protein [Psychroserpens sp. SPM9]|uniref:hypothetical protein n=1 Tax=Psychroserpens sp. SPM9 TaxID=2975598 RepID=UPI0021A6D75E|nr:hypothetical protein [Psychroserpens sp. SPM9]MDG5490583.1 hypothetical protein [Psychroserpens sp. SPM9]
MGEINNNIIMKNVSNFKASLIFVFALVVVFCFVPITRVEVIGDFFEKILYPISFPLSMILAGFFGGKKLKKYLKSKKGKSP